MSTPPESPTKAHLPGTVLVADEPQYLPETHLHDKPDVLKSVPEANLHNKSDFVKDLMFWRNKRLNVLVLLVTTATWVVLEIYGYNFITVASWVSMALVSFMFLWGSTHRILRKEDPDLSGMEISEQSAMESAKLLREQVEKSVRLIFCVGAEKEWFVFAGVVACLYAMSLVANCFDLLTLCYIGVVGGLTVPVIYVKYEHKIREYGERFKMKLQRLHIKIEEIMQKMKKKMAGEHREMKEKKME
ncbi:unnamed protein product [Fraxinus pennsylvanica]|uniref:Reticulon-like protein n=1 Tax=Fraxinus pennsylvanica TaxID=56036 RepID=A0AAD1Z1U0_9LAMI|nr:unnamed protein product [Fraxinus pennsylvanica]